jgi:TetR/AcrR family transcriptional repressor of lmrAB and yxaGH operons
MQPSIGGVTSTRDGAGVRERMIRSAIVQLAKHGLQGASFAEILAHARAPRGSVYHHFPAGKSELVAAALDHMATAGLAPLDVLDGSTVDEIIDGFMAMWRALLERSTFTAGCSIAAVTVTADTPDLIERAAEVFRSWHARLVELLVGAGLATSDAQTFATMLVASAEGAVVLARAARDLQPLDAVQAQLHTLGRTFRPAAPGRPTARGSGPQRP